ncbi:MAG: alpha/beta fold hydrolase [Planctomycetes bacterium]|nr:alpha/beta fold hydrolase [Planctomycetota bacterium]
MSGPDSAMPSTLRTHARWVQAGPAPALVIHPDARGDERPRPYLLWMHGRTAFKEMDNGRYLRLLRAGIATVAIDLPGHGERAIESMQASERTMEVIEAMLRELPEVLHAIAQMPGLDAHRAAIGGMSLGGMVTLVALCRPHTFRAAVVEATTGDWTHLAGIQHDPARSDAMEPARHLDRWSPVPLLAIHAQLDEWIRIDWQRTFLERVRAVNADQPVDLLEFPRTGAPHEHIGFGTFGPQAKDACTAFLRRWLVPEAVSPPR